MFHAVIEEFKKTPLQASGALVGVGGVVLGAASGIVFAVAKSSGTITPVLPITSIPMGIVAGTLLGTIVAFSARTSFLFGLGAYVALLFLGASAIRGFGDSIEDKAATAWAFASLYYAVSFDGVWRKSKRFVLHGTGDPFPLVIGYVAMMLFFASMTFTPAGPLFKGELEAFSFAFEVQDAEQVPSTMIQPSTEPHP